MLQSLPQLLPEQSNFFNAVMHKLDNNSPAIFCLDAPGGTGKTKVLNLLLSKVRSNGDIALAVASSGIAATLLDGGKTAHSGLNIPLDILTTGKKNCNITKNSNKGELLRRCKLLVWDEATMAHKILLEAVDTTLKDIRTQPTLPMGGLVVVLAGDFRQTLPIVQNGTPADQIHACIKNSWIWEHVQLHRFSINMRARLFNNVDSDNFSRILLDIGNGTRPLDADRKITLDNNVCNLVENHEQLITKVYPYLRRNYKNIDWLRERCILAPTNVDINTINNACLDRIPGNAITYTSIDSVLNEDDSVMCPPEVLNSFEMSGIPQHILQLKVGAPIILMRNLYGPNLVNGTRLQITDLKNNLIIAKIMTGRGKGDLVAIPRIPMIPMNCPVRFKRLQFPIKLAFAMTINKAQGQTMTYIGIYLKTECFSHGQLYVALSRVSSSENVYVCASSTKTTNIVYRSIL